MLGPLALFALIVFTLSSQPVWSGSTIVPLHESVFQEQRKYQHLSESVTAQLAAGGRIGTRVQSKEMETIHWNIVSLEKANSWSWYTKQAIEVFSRNLIRPMTFLEFARRYS